MVSISVVTCSWMKCGEVLQCSDGLSDIIRTLLEDRDNMKLLIICSVGSTF